MISYQRMSNVSFSALLALMLFFASVVISSPAHGRDADPWDGDWHGSITPYGWLPGVTAKMRFQFQNTSTQTETDNNILDSLSGAFMLSGDVRKGNWGIYSDVDWVKFDNEKASFRSIGGNFIGGNATLENRLGLKGGFITLAGIYTLSHSQNGYADLLFGGRYLWVKGNLGWNFTYAGDHLGLADSGHLSSQTHVSDVLIGIRGRWIPGGGRWYIPYYLDLGAGGSDLTSQAALGVGYAFDWGDVAFAWRYVMYKRSDTALLQRLTLQGPSIGLTWHF